MVGPIASGCHASSGNLNPSSSRTMCPHPRRGKASGRSFFVSYSRHDEDLVSPVVQLLRTTGVPVFRDADDIPPGKKWRLVLEQSLQDADVVLLFWSSHAAGSMEVQREWIAAMEHEKDLIPVLLDGTPLHKELNNYQYIDFRSIIRAGHSMEDMLEELAELITLRIQGISKSEEDSWWARLRARWAK